MNNARKRARQATLLQCGMKSLAPNAPVSDRAGFAPVRLDDAVVEAQRERMEHEKVARRERNAVNATAAGEARLALTPQPGIRPVGRPLQQIRGSTMARLQFALGPGFTRQVIVTPARVATATPKSTGPRGTYARFSNDEKRMVVEFIRERCADSVSPRRQVRVPLPWASTSCTGTRDHSGTFNSERPLKESTVSGWLAKYKENPTIFGAGVATPGQGRDHGDGHLTDAARAWIRKVCKGLRLSNRAATSAAQKLPADWEDIARLFLLQIAYLAFKHEIPKALVVNADQTGCNIVPISKRTYAKMGSQHIRQVGLDDKRQITIVVASAADGSMLPPQVIFQGGTKRSLPPQDCSKGLMDIGAQLAFSPNHWSNKKLMEQWVELVLLPYLQRTKERLGLPPDHPCMLISDCWQVHLSEAFQAHLKRKCPGILLNGHGLQKPLKDAIRNEASKAFRRQLESQFNSGVAPKDAVLNLRTSAMKPLVCSFILAAWLYLISQPQIVLHAWDSATLSKAWDQDTIDQAIRKVLSEGEAALFPPPRSTPDKVEAMRAATAAKRAAKLNEQAKRQGGVKGGRTKQGNKHGRGTKRAEPEGSNEEMEHEEDEPEPSSSEEESEESEESEAPSDCEDEGDVDGDKGEESEDEGEVQALVNAVRSRSGRASVRPQRYQ
ncbi:hypothetical protein VOLCADRAFT_89437 [Volvox carteri f. nagariensis]|uniref:DDE-1 domain-containing protein n=1 Tax=Volvox carteri f. nagariensis TaxID=3068 RepID=D8TRP4_VOLCA|nr:uncharacterized protein VOLCADRAFT_89437 [Volvox carteri f. nagariensis]EFJ50025.1 hypothetical protein VOLCADRAFT_89437 [Volvox carteri f. nagariensis]|eukprot:XP_002949090.1 hypothetical protein VOLCADRAFT_89437 [Volvox carteri f. nagariensis]